MWSQYLVVIGLVAQVWEMAVDTDWLGLDLDVVYGVWIKLLPLLDSENPECGEKQRAREVEVELS